MSQVIILYGTLTGNTQLVAENVASLLKTLPNNWVVNCQNIVDVSPKIFATLNSGDLILIGSSTWDDGQFPYEMLKFVTDCQSTPPNLTNLAFGCFGCGDSSYGQTFCTAVDQLSHLLTSWGGKEVAAGLKIDGFPEMTDSQVAINLWLNKIKIWLNEN